MIYEIYTCNATDITTGLYAGKKAGEVTGYEIKFIETDADITGYPFFDCVISRDSTGPMSVVEQWSPAPSSLPEYETTLDTVAEAMAAFDAQYTERMVQWILGRRAAVRSYETELRAADEAAGKRTPSNIYYREAFAIAGGKGWWGFMNGYGLQHIEERMREYCAKLVAKRNAKVAEKLVAAGVNGIEQLFYSEPTLEGFNGTWAAHSTAGRVRIRIQTLVAGGHNIQCLHLRRTCTIKLIDQ